MWDLQLINHEWRWWLSSTTCYATFWVINKWLARFNNWRSLLWFRMTAMRKFKRCFPFFNSIRLFKYITMFCWTDNISQNIFHIQYECEEYYVEYCQSNKTLLWIWIMLCRCIPHYMVIQYFCILMLRIYSCIG